MLLLFCDNTICTIYCVVIGIFIPISVTFPKIIPSTFIDAIFPSFFRIIEVDAGKICTIRECVASNVGFWVMPIPSAHESLHTDENGHYKELGYMIRTNNQTFFHAGDMCMYDGLIDTLKQFQIDIAFLPINGRDYFRNRDDIIGNFNCREAVLLAKEIGAEMLVPMHHDLYQVNRVSVADFVSTVEELDAYRKYHIFAPGELYINM